MKNFKEHKHIVLIEINKNYKQSEIQIRPHLGLLFFN